MLLTVMEFLYSGLSSPKIKKERRHARRYSVVHERLKMLQTSYWESLNITDLMVGSSTLRMK
jgi:hypothetical protein